MARTSSVLVVACGLAALVSATAGTAGLDLFSASAPLFAWATGAQGDASMQALYQVAEAEASITNLVLGALGKLPSGDQPLMQLTDEPARSVVIVYVGKQVTSEAIRQASKPNHPLGQLQSLMGPAATLAMPYLQFKGESLQESLQLRLAAEGLAVQVAGCSKPVSAKELQEDVERAIVSNAQVEVLLVCASSRGQLSADALETELQQLQLLQSTVTKAGKAAVMLYASQPLPRSNLRRSLQASNTTTLPAVFSGFGPYTRCDALCQTQVRWLEGMLAILVMALAACAGMTCLNVMDTPTRFEAMKDGTSQGQ